MCKKNCLGCHFLCVYGYHPIHGHWQDVLSHKERSQIIEQKSFYSIQNLKVNYKTYLCCFKGVWDEGEFIRSINSKKDESSFSDEEKNELKKELWKTIINTERKTNNPRANSCFYREFEKAMLLPAAEELEKKEAIQKEASRDRKWVIVGIVVTALATLGAVMLANYLSHKNDYSVHIINQSKNEKLTNEIPIKNLKNITVYWSEKND